MMAKNFVIIALVTLLWFICAYSLAFAPGNPIIGGIQYFGLYGVLGDPDPAYSTTIPSLLYCVFQLMFAIITVAIIASAFAERVKFSSFLIFCAVRFFLSIARLHTGFGGTGGG